MVANDPPNSACRGRPAGRSGGLHVFQLPEVRERFSIRLYGGSSALRTRRGADCKGDRRLSPQPWSKCVFVRSTADSRSGGWPPGLAPLAAGDERADIGGCRASIDDFVQQDLERRFIVRTQVHAGVDRVADTADAAGIRDGRRSRAAARVDRGSRGSVSGIRGAAYRRHRVRRRQRAETYRRGNRGQQRMGVCPERVTDCLRSRRPRGPPQPQSVGNPGVGNSGFGSAAVDSPGCDRVFRRPAHIPVPQGARSRAGQPQLACTSNDNRDSRVVPILIGFAMSRPLTEAPGVHTLEVFNAGIAAQRAGHAVTAEEDYAMVLSLYPSNTSAGLIWASWNRRRAARTKRYCSTRGCCGRIRTSYPLSITWKISCARTSDLQICIHVDDAQESALRLCQSCAPSWSTGTTVMPAIQ